MSVTKIDQANLGFVILAFCIAHVVPLDLLLFSYAILGPAHYLTEISWLHDRQYFTKRRFDYVPLVVLGLATMSLPYLGLDQAIGLGMTYIGLVTCFFLAITMAFVSNWRYRAPIAAVTIVAGLALVVFTPAVWFFILLANMVHLVIFTSVFILLGALRNNSGYAFATLGALIILGSTFFIPGFALLEPTEFSKSYGHVLIPVYSLFLEMIGAEGGNLHVDRVLGFVAFWHIYHNLNWFSKTGIIGWHQISHKRTIFLITAFLGYIGMYVIDYELGFKALVFLGFLHVVLELPLNGHSFVNTGRLIAGRVRPARA